jgi:hypothetical protein
MKKKIISVVIALGLVIGCTGCASWERGLKSVGSDLSGGLNRTVEVYDYSGNLLKTYEGKIDIAESEGGKVLFDMNGNRYSIYNAIVIVEEK